MQHSFAAYLADLDDAQCLNRGYPTCQPDNLMSRQSNLKRDGSTARVRVLEDADRDEILRQHQQLSVRRFAMLPARVGPRDNWTVAELLP